MCFLDAWDMVDSAEIYVQAFVLSIALSVGDWDFSAFTRIFLLCFFYTSINIQAICFGLKTMYIRLGKDICSCVMKEIFL